MLGAPIVNEQMLSIFRKPPWIFFMVSDEGELP